MLGPPPFATILGMIISSSRVPSASYEVILKPSIPCTAELAAGIDL